MKRIGLGAVVLTIVLLVPRSQAQQTLPTATATEGAPATSDAILLPTSHPPVPRDLSQLWLVPQETSEREALRAARDVAAAIKLQAQGDYKKALPALLTPGVEQGPLGDYATYYAGIAQLRLGQTTEAQQTFQTLQKRPLVGYLVEASALGEAETHETLDDPAAAARIYEQLLTGKVAEPDEVLMRLGKAAGMAGDSAKAVGAYARVYYEFPLSGFAPAAGSELTRLSAFQPMPASERYRLSLARAERLFAAKMYPAARSAFESLRSDTVGDDRALVDLRVAECDYFLKRARDAREDIRPYTTDGTRQAEALFFYAVASSDLDDRTEYLKTVRQLSHDFPSERWTEQALDHLATAYIVDDDDEAADATFREMYAKFPKGAFAERAAWKIGWRSYRNGQYADTVRVFEQAAADFPRSDYRPAWLYWSAVAHERLNEPTVADARYVLTATDYLNSYYGRLAATRLAGNTSVPATATESDLLEPRDEIDVVALPPNGNLIRKLIEVALYDDALNELRFAERMWGPSSPIGATIAWIQQKQGQFETGSKRFTLIRGSITGMRRSYPQFLAAGGEALPRDILTVIFPLAYWDLIRKYSAAHELDPYLIAALMAQESTFVPDIKSYTKAVGLMQLMPATARRYAPKVGIRYRASILTNAEMNVRLGMAYFADLIREFGEPHLALASYNAGENAVRRWVAERPGVPREEFIDDIPYPQTQNYVKRILGTAEDYRRLYGTSRAEELVPAVKVSTVPQGVGVPPMVGSPASKPPAKKPPAKKPPVKRRAPPKQTSKR